jgi:hypothetical protein
VAGRFSRPDAASISDQRCGHVSTRGAGTRLDLAIHELPRDLWMHDHPALKISSTSTATIPQLGAHTQARPNKLSEIAGIPLPAC